MNVALWICQGFLFLLFFFSGICKATQPPQRLVAMGQTGVEGLPVPLIRFIGIAEIAGCIGIVVPWILHLVPVLTPIAAACLGLIMILAARVHYRRSELQTVALNVLVLAVALFVVIGRAA